MLDAWIIFTFASGAVSVTMLSLVQIRVISKDGFRALRPRPVLPGLVALYWTNLSRLERALLWPGLVAFFLTMLGGFGFRFITSFTQ